MTIEEKQQLYMESFLKGQEIHRQRELEWEFHKKRVEETKKSMIETQENKLNINLSILNLLSELGFDITTSGTKYLANVIETLYYERKLFDAENEFFDFNDRNNNHYSFTNEYYECGLINLQRRIDEEVEKSNVSNNSLNDIIYGVANNVISQYDEAGKQLVFIGTK